MLSLKVFLRWLSHPEAPEGGGLFQHETTWTPSRGGNTTSLLVKIPFPRWFSLQLSSWGAFPAQVFSGQHLDPPQQHLRWPSTASSLPSGQVSALHHLLPVQSSGPTGPPLPWCQRASLPNPACWHWCLEPKPSKNSLGAAVATTRPKGAFIAPRLSQSWSSFVLGASLLPLAAVIEIPAYLRAGLSSELQCHSFPPLLQNHPAPSPAEKYRWF